MFAAGDAHLGSDAVFGVKRSLIAPFPLHPPGRAPDGTAMQEPYHTLDYDLILARSDR